MKAHPPDENHNVLSSTTIGPEYGRDEDGRLMHDSKRRGRGGEEGRSTLDVPVGLRWWAQRSDPVVYVWFPMEPVLVMISAYSQLSRYSLGVCSLYTVYMLVRPGT